MPPTSPEFQRHLLLHASRELQRPGLVQLQGIRRHRCREHRRRGPHRHCGHDAPVAVDDQFGTPANTPLSTGNVLTNDTDVDGNVLQAVPESGATKEGGTVAILRDGTFTYIPKDDFSGTDTFSYTVKDGSQTANDAAGGTVTITVARSTEHWRPIPSSANQTSTASSSAPSTAQRPGVLHPRIRCTVDHNLPISSPRRDDR